MKDRSDYSGGNRFAAAKALLSHPDIKFLAHLFSEIETDALSGLRAGDDIGKHVAAIQAVETIRIKIRLEAENTGLKEDPLA